MSEQEKDRPERSGITQEDIEAIKLYIDKIKKLNKSEPQKIQPSEWVEFLSEIKKTGEIPEKYQGRISESSIVSHEKIINGQYVYLPDGEVLRTYYDTEWEEWNKKGNEIRQQFNSVILKALRSNTTPEDLEKTILERLELLVSAEILSGKDATQATVENLLAKAYLPMLNNTQTNDFSKMTVKNAVVDQFTHKATITTGNSKITIENFDKLRGALSTSAKKILDTALLYLTNDNFYGAARTVNPSVEIPLKEYGEACGYQLTPQTMDTPEEQAAENRRVDERKKDLKKKIRRDLEDISQITWTGEITKGKDKGDYANMRIISSHRIIKGVIRINFDIDAARLLVRAYIMYFPVILLKHDNRKPNAYALGQKIAYHNSNDNNYAAGTNNTLSVKSLLAAMPEITSVEKLKARGQANWKDKIKRPLEDGLNENVAIGYLKKWEYRDPKTSQIFTPEEAQPLTWTRYSRLVVDFIVVDAPDQTERRAAKAAAKEAACKEKTAEKPKRQTKKGGCSRKQKGGV